MSEIYHSGRGAAAMVGPTTPTVELPVTGWSVSPNVEKVNFRNSKTGRFSQTEQTFLSCTFSIRVDHSFAAGSTAGGNPYSTNGAGLGMLGGGTAAARLFLGPNGTNSTSFWDFPSAILTSNPQTVEIEGKLQDVFNFEANGPWVEPQ